MELSLLLKINGENRPVLAQIEELVLDASLNEVHTMPSKVTQFPIETGATITDHVTNEPVKVSITGFVSNNPILPSDQRAQIDLGNLPPPLRRAQAALFDLKRIRGKRLPVSIVTGLDNYSDMVMSTLTINRNSSVGDALEFTAEFVQVQFVSSASIPASFLNSSVKHNAKSVDAGKRTPKGATGSFAQKSSILKKAKDALVAQVTQADSATGATGSW